MVRWAPQRPGIGRPLPPPLPTRAGVGQPPRRLEGARRRAYSCPPPAQVPDLSAEIAKVAGQDIGAAFEQKLAELRASGKLRLPRGRVAGAEDPHRGPTVWDRLRTRKD